MSDTLEDDDTLLSFTVPIDGGGRLDKALAMLAAGDDLSRARLQKLIAEGAVQVNDRVVGSASLKVKPGDVIAVVVPPPVAANPVPENIPLSIVFEDDDLLVIDKPAGLVVHPGAGNQTGTLVNALLYHCRDTLSGIGGVMRPGIVHRLDKDTSGLMVVAKNDHAHHALAAQLADRSLSRRYTAFVWRVPTIKKGKVDAPIGRHPANRLKMAIRPAGAQGARTAITHYLAEEIFGGAAARLSCDLETGRTHQIRVHMEKLGHRLIGDPLYGLPEQEGRALLSRAGAPAAAQDAILAFPRQALHAAQIRFIHPRSGEETAFEAPLPVDLQNLYDHLKSMG